MTQAILDRTRVSAAAASLGSDAVLILDMKRCDHCPRLLQELDVLLTLQPRGRDEDGGGDDARRKTILHYIDISAMDIEEANTWIPGVPVLVTMNSVSLGLQAINDSKKMVENGCDLKKCY